MSTAIALLGGVGLFLLGMAVMTEGLKAMAGSALRTVLGQAAATPVSGAFWGGVVTLLVQSSSAVTMATVDAARRLDRIAHHAWRSTAHLLGRGGHDDLDPRPQPESTSRRSP